MAKEIRTIARPYAEAIFDLGKKRDNLEQWREILMFLSSLVEHPDFEVVIRNPHVDEKTLKTIVLDIAGERLSEEAANLVRVMISNRRLGVVSAVRDLYLELLDRHKGMLKVQVRSAQALTATQKKSLATALKAKFGSDIEINAEKDPSLIGGVHIRAGDTVIDGSIKGRLQQLASEFGL